MPSLVLIANPPFTPGSQATIVLFIGFCLLGPNSERVADIDPGDHAQWHQDCHAHDCDDGVHLALNALSKNLLAASNFQV